MGSGQCDPEQSAPEEGWECCSTGVTANPVGSYGCGQVSLRSGKEKASWWLLGLVMRNLGSVVLWKWAVLHLKGKATCFHYCVYCKIQTDI